MLTRRGMLTGVAAASIAAIATSRDSAAAQAGNGGGLGFSWGDVRADSALGSFNKHSAGFDVFLKLEDSAAALYFRSMPGGGTELFYKFFHKGWTPLANQFLKFESLDGMKGVLSFDSSGAEFFLKIENQFVAGVTVAPSVEDFLKIDYPVFEAPVE